MIENILDLVKKEVGGMISSNANVPEDKKGAAIEATASGFLDGLKKQATGGILSSLLGSKSGGSTDFLSQTFLSPIMSMVESKLVSTVGLSEQVAKSISSITVPAVMKLLSSKSKDGNDSFSLESLVSSLSTEDGKSGGLLGTIGGLLGKK